MVGSRRYCFFTFEGVWVKHMCDSVPMDNWARVFYANLVSSPVLMVIFAFAKKEQAILARMDWNFTVVGPFLLSCIMGVAMSHASYLLRSYAAATTAAVVGIMCKLLSVVLNVAIWDKHATATQIGFLLLGIAAAGAYRQAPLRPLKRVSDPGDMAERGGTVSPKAKMSPRAGR